MDGGKIFSGADLDDQHKQILQYPSLGHRILERLSTISHDSIAMVDAASGRKYTGLELKDKILNVACALVQVHGLKPGEVACIKCEHSHKSCILALAVVVAGGVAAFSFTKDPYAELLYLARKVEPRFLFCNHNNLDFATRLESDMGYKVTAITMDGGGVDETCCFDYLLNHNHERCSCISLPVSFENTHKQVAFITMTSGTTGRPKAVPVTHRKCLADLDLRIYGERHVFACPVSLDYVTGRLKFLGALEAGYTAVIVNGLDLSAYLRAIEKHKISFAILAAQSLFNFIEHPDVACRDLSSFRVICTGASRMNHLDAFKKFLHEHPGVKKIIHLYGSSECSMVSERASSVEAYLQDIHNTGRLLPGFHAKIVCTETGKLLGPNQVGMLHIKSQAPFPGYYDLEHMRRLQSELGSCTEVSPFFKDETILDQDGFYISGDLAYFNDNHELYIRGRQKELIVCNAAKILPQELEEIVDRHPATAWVCVLGIPSLVSPGIQCPRCFVALKTKYYGDDEESDLDEMLNQFKPADGDRLNHKGNHKLCTVPTDRRRRIAESILAYVNSQVAWKKQVTGGVVVLDDLPTMRNTSKIDKGYLRSLGCDQVEIYGDKSGQK